MVNLEPEFVHKDDRRTLAQLLTMRFEQVNRYDIKRGATVGDHYHKETTECFYILKGTVWVSYSPVETHPAPRVPLASVKNKGAIFIIEPMTKHTLKALTDVSMMTFLSRAFDERNPDLIKEAP